MKDLAKITKALTCLYVEDEKDTREIVGNNILPRFFAEIRSAENGAEGLRLFEEKRPDIIITDLNMPKLNGIEMIKSIRDIDEEVSIIIMSAHNDTNFFLSAIELGVDGYLLKPLSDTMLIKTIYKCAEHINNKRELELLRKKELDKKELMIKYQENKIATYNELLEELLVIKYFRKPKTKQTSTQAEESKEYLKSDAILNSEERELLRREKKHIISALEYIKDVGSEIVEEVGELEEIEKNLKEAIEEFGFEPTKDNLTSIVRLLEEYAKYMKLLIEFEDLTRALESLATFLDELGESEIEIHKAKLLLYIENIFADLKQWREQIFVVQESRDIHYLDSSLFSSILQVQLDLVKSEGLEDDGNDVELF